MSAKQVLWVDELSSFYQTVLFELPSTAAKMMFDGDERRFRAVGWKAYDSWVRLANETANQLYSNSAFSGAAGRAFEAALGLRRLSGVLVSAAFATAWPALGLPIATEVTTIRQQAIALRQELGTLSAESRLDHVARIEPSREMSLETGGERATSDQVRLSQRAA